ncbi:MAG: large conductance mechanosensitive channel protein MscL [Caldisericales bacterium]|nr:large conductance mechanosensitive channel protein MscL [Caldisericia bacterium]MCE5176241.1 large conductance mechanosensitive channel protein MscL [bacterium]
MFKEFKEFALKGNVIDLAVGVVIGAAFGAIVNSLVNDIIMPPIGFLLGRIDFSNMYLLISSGKTPPPYASLAEAKAAGAVTWNFGLFINALISFLIISFSIFIVVKMINRLRKEKPAEKPAPTQKECPFCFTLVPIKATKCPNCTSEIK